MAEHAKLTQPEKTKDTAKKIESEKTPSPANRTGIPNAMKARFEGLSGFSFDDVRVHYNSGKPARLQAFAYTQGNQVYVGPGQEAHLWHELVHVVQQKQGRISVRSQINDDPILEKEASAGVVNASSEPAQGYSDAIQRIKYPNANVLMNDFLNKYSYAQAAKQPALTSPDSILSSLRDEANSILGDTGIDLTLVFSPVAGDQHGLASYNDNATGGFCTITIDPSRSFEESLIVFLHELTHVIAHYCYYHPGSNEQIAASEYDTHTGSTVTGTTNAASSILNWIVTSQSLVSSTLASLPDCVAYITARLQNIQGNPLFERDATISDIMAYLTIKGWKDTPLYNHFKQAYALTRQNRAIDLAARLASLAPPPTVPVLTSA
ncbi:MAG: DUF4157 domain-containing protein [Oscillospiraceae bacterium]|jgi:hypothetical protein|nr:DUF4157 domain-containing protein [Oscillospiraceae bacterium]